jgi:phosphate transport system substrate-binding protein
MNVKKILVLVLSIFMVFAVTGCSAKEKKTVSTEEKKTASTKGNETSSAEDGADLSGTIVITGSTSVEKIVNDMIDEFTALNPDVSINYTGTGSSAGIQDSIDGNNTIGASSRNVKQEELDAGIKKEEFAYDGIAVAVHPANQVKDISVENLLKIYSGEVTNWNQVGGADAEIVVVSREGSSGTRSAFEELVGIEVMGLTESATVVEGNGNVQTTVAGNENSIGYISFSYIDDSVKALTVDKVEPNAENAQKGTYSLSRPFLFVYTDETITPEAKKFLEFAKSSEGQGFVEEHGGIRID